MVTNEDRKMWYLLYPIAIALTVLGSAFAFV